MTPDGRGWGFGAHRTGRRGDGVRRGSGHDKRRAMGKGKKREKDQEEEERMAMKVTRVVRPGRIWASSCTAAALLRTAISSLS